jgi:hypothetical protein
MEEVGHGGSKLGHWGRALGGDIGTPAPSSLSLPSCQEVSSLHAMIYCAATVQVNRPSDHGLKLLEL